MGIESGTLPVELLLDTGCSMELLLGEVKRAKHPSWRSVFGGCQQLGCMPIQSPYVTLDITLDIALGGSTTNNATVNVNTAGHRHL
jgi:hypothetical protein